MRGLRDFAFFSVLLGLFLTPAFGAGLDSLRVQGVVMNSAGEKIEGAEVRLVPATPTGEVDTSGVPVTVETKRKGKFTFAFLKPGQYLLEATSGAFVLSHVKIQMRDKDRRVPTLADGSRLEDVEGAVDPAKPQVILGIPSDVYSVKLELTLAEPPAETASGDMTLGLEQDEIETAADAFRKLEAGRYEEGLAEIDALLLDQPDNAALHYMRGYAKVKLGAIAEAEAPLARAMELNPELNGGWGLYGQVLAELGKFEPAVNALGEELARVSDPAARAPLLLARGQALLELDKAGDAVPVLEEAFGIDPNDVTRVQLIDAYVRSGKDAEAETLLADLTAADAATLHFNLAANYLRAKRWDEAVTHLQQARELNPELHEALRFMGEAYSSQGRYADAALAYEEYLELEPDAPDAEQLRQITDALREAAGN